MKKLATFVSVALALAFASDVIAQGRNLLNARRRPGNAQAQNHAPAPAPAASSDATTSSLNFNATPVDMVFEAYSRMVGKTILKDPQVPNATITLKSEAGQTLTQDEQIEAIEVVLEMNGIHLEPYGEKFVRALPRKDVRKDGIPLIMDSEAELKDGNRVVSLMLPFKNIGTEEAQKALEGFKSASGILLVFERTNSILITDTEANINRMREIARTIDVATPVLENVFVRQIKNASATEIKTALEAIVQESQKELEKNGKQVQNAPQQHSRPLMAGRLLRPGQQQQNAAPVNNESQVTTVSDADRGMIRGKVLILADERSNKLIVVTQKSNMDFFDRVIEALDIETTPDTVVKVYRLKYAEAEDVSDMINDLIGNSASGKSNSKGNQNANAKNGSGGNMTRNTSTKTAKAPANQRTGDAKAGELTKDNTTVLADKRINGIVVMTEKELVPTIENIIESMDIKLSQVLIETVIIEVGLGDGIETGVDWISRGRVAGTAENGAVQKRDQYGRKLFYAQETLASSPSDSATILDYLVPEGYSKTVKDNAGNVIGTISASESGAFETLRDGFANYFSGGSYSLGGGANGGVSAVNAMTSIVTNFTQGGGMNFILKSDRLNLGAIVHASKSDSRSKYIASPIIMTLDNKEATIEATEMVYLFKGYQYSGSTYTGSPVKDYEQKELGITIKVTPKINPNGTVMLTLKEEYSQEGAGQLVDGETQATTVTRKMSADALLENNQTVIFAGLTTTRTSESATGVPFLQDIPWIGKWLFSSVAQQEKRTELMVFMTPYVLDDANAAEAEALRRKKSLSDPRAWDDHGWSASKLADPVSKKEMMRRLKDEWKKQDEERQTRLAIEQQKVERAKALKEMSIEERNLWLKMHKDELKKEQQEELEKKMLDKESQKELKKLADKIRAEKLESAEKELKANEEATSAENERGKMDAEKAKAAAEAEAATEEAVDPSAKK